MRNVILAATALSLPIAPAGACEETSPQAKAWTKCAYQTAKRHGEHRFLENYVDVLFSDSKILKTAPARWYKLLSKINIACGFYDTAVQKDRATGPHDYIPRDYMNAFANTSDYKVPN